MKSQNAEVNKYLKLISRHYHGSRKDKMKLTEELKTSINDYLEENPTATCEELSEHFGIVEEIAPSILPEEQQKKKRAKFICISIGLCIIVAAAIFFTAYKVSENYEYSRGRETNRVYDDKNDWKEDKDNIPATKATKPPAEKIYDFD